MKIGVYSMARSGHHAIIYWMKANALGPLEVLDNENWVMENGPRPGCDIHVIIIRDPFNWAASWIHSVRKWMKPEKFDSQLPEWVDRWKAHAKEILGRSLHFEGNFFAVSYNDWFMDAEYRKQLANDLGIGTEDKGLNRVPDNGGGSSWDNTIFDGKAQDMGVLTRWELKQDNEDWRSVAFDPEVQELAKQLFGWTISS